MSFAFSNRIQIESNFFAEPLIVTIIKALFSRIMLGGKKATILKKKIISKVSARLYLNSNEIVRRNWKTNIGSEFLLSWFAWALTSKKKKIAFDEIYRPKIWPKWRKKSFPIQGIKGGESKNKSLRM